MEDLPRDLARSGALDIKKYLESISGGKVLDVATQGGTFIRTLIDYLLDYDSLTGIDISSETWNEDRFSNYPVKFLEMNAELLDFNDSTFDTVSISHSLHHLASIEKVLAEMKRVLKSDGTFILQEMYCDNSQSDAQKADILSHHFGAKIDSLLGISHYPTLTKQEIKRYVSQLNLQSEIIIETTHPVNCILCDDKFSCDNPKNSSSITLALKDIDNNLDKLRKAVATGIIIDDANLNNLLIEGKKIKKRIHKYGSAPASHLFILGRK